MLLSSSIIKESKEPSSTEDSYAPTKVLSEAERYSMMIKHSSQQENDRKAPGIGIEGDLPNKKLISNIRGTV